MKLFIGTSGYSYKHWADGVFYPAELAQKKWLEFYTQQFNCVELNVTFYRLPKQSVFRSWDKRTPKNFTFVVKGSRFITHIKRLKDVGESLKIFADAVAPLKKKACCFLWQLPPSFKKDASRLEDFCQKLTETKLLRSANHVFEFREQSWFCDDIYDLLKRFNFCLCFADSPKKIGEEVLTSDLSYIRFHGGSLLYGSNYSRKELSTWVKKVHSWPKDIKTLYVFFNNDAQGFAPDNASTFRELLCALKNIRYEK